MAWFRWFKLKHGRAPFIRESAAWMNNDLLRKRDPESGEWVSCVHISESQAGRYFEKVLRAHTVSRKNAKMQDHGRADVVKNRQQHCRLRLEIAARSLHLPVPDFLVTDIQHAVDAVVMARKHSVVSMATLSGSTAAAGGESAADAVMAGPEAPHAGVELDDASSADTDSTRSDGDADDDGKAPMELAADAPAVDNTVWWAPDMDLVMRREALYDGTYTSTQEPVSLALTGIYFGKLDAAIAQMYGAGGVVTLDARSAERRSEDMAPAGRAGTETA